MYEKMLEAMKSECAQRASEISSSRSIDFKEVIGSGPRDEALAKLKENVSTLVALRIRIKS